MIFIKFFLIAMLCLLYGFFKHTKKNPRFYMRFLSLAMLFISSIAVLFPSLTTRVAHWVGIGRGVDLIFYIVIIFMLFVLTGLRIRVVQLQKNQNLLVRHIAIMQARTSGTAAKAEDKEKESRSTSLANSQE